MKKILALLLALAMTMALVACGGNTNSGNAGGNNNDGGNTNAGNQSADLAGTYDITMWVSELSGVAELTQQQIDIARTALYESR